MTSLCSRISQPETVHYNMSRYSVQEKLHERDIGPELYHVYEISNAGPSEIATAEAYILWPTYTLPEGGYWVLPADRAVTRPPRGGGARGVTKH